jgi:diguanylate cyclase (GGDEF)-like protein
VELIGRDISEYILEPSARDFYTECIKGNGAEISETETLFKKKDNSQFIGLITMVSTIYNKEEVVFLCVIDMTEQKKTEEMLKQNNENIARLNNELVKMNNILENKSVKDSLTNLFNHQYMNEILEAKLQEITKTKENLCLMMLDIDHFKQVNDRFGHLFGDKVLVTVTELIRSNTRSYDYVGRYGGEEFIAVLPNTDLQEAFIIAENIRKSIQDFDYSIDSLKVTISIGVVQYSGEMPHVLINKADMLLYKAKNLGRNRVEK